MTYLRSFFLDVTEFWLEVYFFILKCYFKQSERSSLPKILQFWELFGQKSQLSKVWNLTDIWKLTDTSRKTAKIGVSVNWTIHCISEFLVEIRHEKLLALILKISPGAQSWNNQNLQIGSDPWRTLTEQGSAYNFFIIL